MKKKTDGSRSALVGQTVCDLLQTKVEFQGRMMSAREAMLLGVYNRALNGDIDASIELQRIRGANNVDGPRPGCLVVPEAPSLDEWMRLAAEQQAPYRENKYGDDPG